MDHFLTPAFTTHFGDEPTLLVRAPGRVNLIGEHTDYNEGFVLPLAINRAVWLALRPRPDGQVVLHSLDMDSPVQFDVFDLHQGAEGWGEYVKGVAWALGEAGYTLRGWEGVLTSNVPIGAGLSSSAALELAITCAFAAVAGWDWSAREMALLSQRAENQWVGVNCGIMDQMISAAGEADHALLIDCRTLETTAVPLPTGTAVVILDTATRRGLVDSAYNERRAQCETAARYFGVPFLRDVSPERFAAEAGGLDPLTQQRAGHVVGENARVLAAVQTMRRGDAAELGRLMNASHVSLRDDFQVSTEALNTIVALAQAHPACYGARMTGAGFGGCAVALVQELAAESFAEHVTAEYTAATGLTPQVYITPATAGASMVEG